MFSPAPARYDGWYVLEATTDRNRTVDLWPVLFTGVADEAEVPAPTWDAPEFPAHHYPSTKVRAGGWGPPRWQGTPLPF